MTLSKQLCILISVLLLTIFSVNYVVGMKTIRSHFQAEAQMHAQVTAKSLGLSLTPYILKESDPVLKTMLSTIFDLGYFEEIKLHNASDKTLVKLTHNKIFQEVPDWFINLLPMETATAESEISSGWTFGGTLYVTISPDIAYLKLYQHAKSALYYSLGVYLLSVTLLILVLRFTLKPLKTINAHTLRIAEGHFDTITPSPWTAEFRNVAHSINIMSRKLNGVMANLNEKLPSLGQKLQLDSLTGLCNKNTFDSDLKQLYLENTESYLFLIKIDILKSLAKEVGNAAIDVFLQNCAAQLKQTAQNFSRETTAYHFYGADFAVLTRNCQPLQARKLASALSMTLTELGHAHQRADIGHIGVVAIDLLGECSEMLNAASEAYEQAAMIGPNSYYIRTGTDRAKDIAEWKSRVFEVIDSNAYKIELLGGVKSFDDRRILMEEAYAQAFDKNGAALPIGIFVSIAEKYEKIVALDKGILEQVIGYLNCNASPENIAVNLSTRTIKNADFRTWLADQLKLHNSITPRLIIGLSAYAVSKDFNAYQEFIKFVRHEGVRVLLKRFDSQSMAMDQLKLLKPDFIRLNRELSNNLEGNSEKTAFLQTIKEMGDLLDIAVIAENIASDSDLRIAENLGLAGASR